MKFLAYIFYKTEVVMDYKKYEVALNELEKNTVDRLNQISKCDASMMGRGDEADQTLEASEREMNINMQSNLRRTLTLIAKQKERFVNEEVDECEECGSEISERRLTVNPLAFLCVDCQEDLEG
jgi:RNA polymerase-binding transcription factor DksA